MSFATRTATIAALLTLTTGAAQAQNAGPLSLELRTGAGIPTKSVGEHDLDPGLALSLTANVQVMPHLNLYVGREQVHFGLQQNIGEFDVLEDCGYTLGARFFTPSFGPVTPWIRAGAIYDQVELEADDVDEVDSDFTFGWEAGAGAAVALGGRWSLLPGVRYRSFKPELAQLGGEVDMNAVVLDIGISATFGGRPMAAIRHR